MPSPESPAKRMTARSMTSRLDLVVGGTSASVDISWPKPSTFLELPPECGSNQNEAVRERMASQADRREPTCKEYHTGSPREGERPLDVRSCVGIGNLAKWTQGPGKASLSKAG